jgi:4'-phosphopantetheinyl transferase
MHVYWLEQTEADVPTGNDWLSASEVERLNGMRFAKRRTDWRLGRWTAKCALAACLNGSTPVERPRAVKDPRCGDLKVCEAGSDRIQRTLPDCVGTGSSVRQPGYAGLFHSSLASIEIRPAPSGAPEVFFVNDKAIRPKDQGQILAPPVPVAGLGPTSVTISLSHRGAMAVCAVTMSGGVLGCDLETVEPRSDAFVADYFTTEEQTLIAQASKVERSQLATLLWSAKESALKALRAGLRLDTRCVSVEGFGIRNLESETGEWQPLRVRYTDGGIFHGWWRNADNRLRTLVAFPPPFLPIVLR